MTLRERLARRGAVEGGGGWREEEREGGEGRPWAEETLAAAATELIEETRLARVTSTLRG